MPCWFADLNSRWWVLNSFFATWQNSSVRGQWWSSAEAVEDSYCSFYWLAHGQKSLQVSDLVSFISSNTLKPSMLITPSPLFLNGQPLCSFPLQFPVSIFFSWFLSLSLYNMYFILGDLDIAWEYIRRGRFSPILLPTGKTRSTALLKSFRPWRKICYVVMFLTTPYPMFSFCPHIPEQ